MGWAIVWIMMLHFTFITIKPLGFIAQYGFAGVDIFMFVSGFGLYFSIDHNKNLLAYFKKRIIRIFPTYYLVGIASSLIIYHDTLPNYIFRYSTIGFWTNSIYWEWYIPSIVVFYLLAPIFKRAIDSRLITTITLFAIIILIASYIIVSQEFVNDKDPHFFMLYRAPEFIFGMICGHWTKKGTAINLYYILMTLGIPFFIILFPKHHDIYNFKYLSLAFLLPLFTISFITLSKQIKQINPVLSKIGKASLEIYLIQAIFFEAIITKKLIISPTWHDTITIALIITCILLGITIHQILDKYVLPRM